MTRQPLQIILLALTCLACAGTVAGFFGRHWWTFELASHFRFQYLVCLLAVAAIHLLRKDYCLGLLAGVFAIINLHLVHPVYQPAMAARQSHETGQTIRALLLNVNHDSYQHERVREFLRSSEADVMLLLEVDREWMENLEPLKELYPFRESRSDLDDGIALFSRAPFSNAEFRTVGSVGSPSVVAQFEAMGQGFTLIGTHPTAPTSRESAQSRNRQLGALARFVSTQNGPVVLMGDLNTTPWSPYFNDLLSTTGLRDTREGLGIQPTWPSSFPPFLIPIDHCLVSSAIVVRKREVGPDIGSDHRAVIVEFGVDAG